MPAARSPPPRRSGASSRTSACSCTVGVATGRAFCGIFGSDLRREYTLHGEVVNLASRLMQASARRDPVLRRHRAGGARERRLRGAGAGHAEGARRAGGGAPRLVDAQRRERRASRGWSGARPSSAAISARIDDLVTDGGSATVVIEGEAGLGKSLLVARGDPPGAGARRARAHGRGRRGRERHELLRLARDVHRPARGHPADDGSTRTPSRCRATRSCGGCARCSAASSRSASPTTS